MEPDDNALSVALSAHGEIGALRGRLFDLERRQQFPPKSVDAELSALWWVVVALALALYVLARRVRRAEEERATDGRSD